MVKRCCYGTCHTDSRYLEIVENGIGFIPFPKPARNLENACGESDCVEATWTTERKYTNSRAKHIYICIKVGNFARWIIGLYLLLQKIENIVCTCSRTGGRGLPSIESPYYTAYISKMEKKTDNIMNDFYHADFSLFKFLPSTSTI